MERLQKIIASSGYCSRRKAEELILKGKVKVNGEIIKKLGISEGDKFDVVEKDGGIFLCPVIVYPKDKLIKIAKLIKDSESELSKQQDFDTVEGMFADMGIDVNDV